MSGSLHPLLCTRPDPTAPLSLFYFPSQKTLPLIDGILEGLPRWVEPWIFPISTDFTEMAWALLRSLNRPYLLLGGNTPPDSVIHLVQKIQELQGPAPAGILVLDHPISEIPCMDPDICRIHASSGESVLKELTTSIEGLFRHRFSLPAFGWEQRNTVPTLDANELQVWRIPLDLPETEIGPLEFHLNEAEKNRAQRFKFSRDRNQFIVGRANLRMFLGAHLRQEPAAVAITYANKGKPTLANSTLEFNLAHSGGLALLAITNQHAVGIDLEQVQEKLDLMTIAERFFTPAEVEHLLNQRLEHQRETFYRTWARKESYMKATGLGLYMPLDQFGILPSSEPGWLRLHLVQEPHQSARWSLCDLEPGLGYTAAIAVENHRWKLTTHSMKKSD